jgi:thymidylate synthase ThyX
MYDCKILADSVSPDGVRLCTQQVTFPRFILAEVNTHRDFSRNSASSRAMPVEKNIERMLADMFVPAAFGSNKKGMQAGASLAPDDNEKARRAWVAAADQAAYYAGRLAQLGVHKQWANRIIEFASWHTAIITATAWENWDNLRDNAQASPEIQAMAQRMKAARSASTPRQLKVGEWHLPLVYLRGDEAAGGLIEGSAYGISIHADGSHTHGGDSLLPIEQQVKLSVARCARVSYLTHDGKRDVDADLALYDRLVTSGHMSPLEHAAKVASKEEINQYALWKKVETGLAPPLGNGLARRIFDFVPVRIGNLSVPWLQHRKMIAGEDVFRR